MEGDNEKVLKVTLSDTDVKIMNKNKTRRARNKKTEVVEPITQLEKETVPAVANVPVVPNAPAVAVLANVTVVSNVQKNIPGAVTIKAKKNNPAPSTPTPNKIVMNMNKKRTTLPLTTTFKKPKFIVNAAEDKKKKRRFTERKISITMKSLATTRKESKDIKDKVYSMPIAQVKKLLLRKGLLKPNLKTPEAILRSILLDYMTLH